MVTSSTGEVILVSLCSSVCWTGRDAVGRELSEEAFAAVPPSVPHTLRLSEASASTAATRTAPLFFIFLNEHILEHVIAFIFFLFFVQKRNKINTREGFLFLFFFFIS